MRQQTPISWTHNRRVAWRAVIFPVLALLLASLQGCVSRSMPESQTDPAATPAASSLQSAQALAGEARMAELNRQLATRASASPIADRTAFDYRLGPGDLIKIEAPQAPEINGLTARLSGPGTIALPLLGEVALGGMTTTQAQQAVVERLAKYIHQPQVSVSIAEYTSQEITVTGAVVKPGVYPIQRPRTLIEVLSLAGGLASGAGSTIDVRTQASDPRTGQSAPQRFIIDIKELLKDPNSNGLLVRGGDSIYVAQAGYYFVDGAVGRPGAYPLQPGTSAYKAATIAGGTKWDAVLDQVRVIRTDESGNPVEKIVDIAAVRDRGAPDMPLQEGDVVVVDTNAVKSGFVTLWDNTFRVIALGALF
ncbi:MAG: polysaccharide biosynthesis/export family protein [Chromatiaceae bacterium]|nr:polysaccharide biosynthesis/export family protein [Chromatiaceae bacterium]